MEFYCIASGSSGNCLYFDTGSFSFLVDAGVSAKRICSALDMAGLKYPEAIFITHEHSDHISGLEVFLKKHSIPVFGTKATLGAVMYGFKGIVPKDLFISITPEKNYVFRDLEIKAHSAPHDAADPVFYEISSGGKRAAVVTDMGYYKPEYVGMLRGLDLLYLESNHDPNMLMAGSYPYSLKQRILSRYGHLSNDTAAEFAVQLLHPGLKTIVLGHLSKENNYAELAYETMKCAVFEACHCRAATGTDTAAAVPGRSDEDVPLPQIIVANRDIPTGPLFF